MSQSCSSSKRGALRICTSNHNVSSERDADANKTQSLLFQITLPVVQHQEFVKVIENCQLEGRRAYASNKPHEACHNLYTGLCYLKYNSHSIAASKRTDLRNELIKGRACSTSHLMKAVLHLQNFALVAEVTTSSLQKINYIGGDRARMMLCRSFAYAGLGKWALHNQVLQETLESEEISMNIAFQELRGMCDRTMPLSRCRTIMTPPLGSIPSN